MTYEELNSKYPDILGKTLSECPEGWYSIISELCEQILWINNQICDDGIGYIKFFQIKEKFFGLRAYHSLTKDDTVNKIVEACVHEAEFKAKWTCAVCGERLIEDEKFICDKCRGGEK